MGFIIIAVGGSSASMGSYRCERLLDEGRGVPHIEDLVTRRRAPVMRGSRFYAVLEVSHERR